MKKVVRCISVVGTTSVGKSECALKLAQSFATSYPAVYLLSVDSKQVFRGLECLSGADIPAGFIRTHDAALSERDFFSNGKLSLFGTACCELSERWSVAHFKQYSLSVLQHAAEHDIPVILVGGAGLYHEQLFAQNAGVFVPPNTALRAEAATSTAAELYEQLARTAPSVAQMLNNSDKHNPRRLVRALERVQAAAQEVEKTEELPFNYTGKIIGLRRPLEATEAAIKQRVLDRFAATACNEVAAALQRNPSEQAVATLGFAECAAFLAGEVSRDECLRQWQLSELQYAKRQLTWWKRNAAVHWVERNNARWFDQVLALAND